MGFAIQKIDQTIGSPALLLQNNSSEQQKEETAEENWRKIKNVA